MGGIGGPELLIVLLVVLLVFGPRKIPEIARMMGKGMREFRRLSTEFQRELNIADALEGKPPPRRPGPPSLPASGPGAAAASPE
ncbi:twin-arginine translocase TatA/TatE family subunit, partial [bacterium]|nr:twin-arginine translocase TatA/TatE family subunit [bacterium]